MPKNITTIDMDSKEYQATSGEWDRSRDLIFKINQTAPSDPKQRQLVEELLNHTMDESSMITAPMQIDRGQHLHLGKNVYINHSLTAVTTGGITIEDNVMIAPHVFLLTANHDFHNHHILYVSPIRIKKHAWIGANAMILPGVTIGENSVVAGSSVVTKDVPDNVVVGGNPAKVIKEID